MYYRIRHQTTYSYNQTVYLRPHVLRLRPRCNGWQKLHSFVLEIDPKPQNLSELTDLDGNAIAKVWFADPCDRLRIITTSEVETCCDNPFIYLLDAEALQLPVDYRRSLALQLAPYLTPYDSTFDPVAVELARTLARETEGNVVRFLDALNQAIYDRCEQIIRPEGPPWSPTVTWTEKRGSCRDYTVLFAEVCRAAGLAARFVSGYQEGDRDATDRELHAWVEVYLPGGGWRGYDPTHALVVADRHIALVASPFPEAAAPVTGNVTPLKPGFASETPVRSQLEYRLEVAVC